VLLGELDDAAAAAEAGGLVEISPTEYAELTDIGVRSEAVLPWDFES
jgi:hypothetical protein